MFSTPCLSVTLELGQPAQEPASSSQTMPVSASKRLKNMSPPSSCTAGRMRESRSSSIMATTSSSSSSTAPLIVAPSSALACSRAAAPDPKCSIISLKTTGLSRSQVTASALLLLTVTKSGPRKMASTPSMPRSFCASGLRWMSRASLRLMYTPSPSLCPAGSTTSFGTNLSDAGFGVGSVWMNRLRSSCAGAGGAGRSAPRSSGAEPARRRSAMASRAARVRVCASGWG
mmetsp:Transcript_46450/g.145344  ORF Transcript_46450/g.145344 Transcript_46450/m.145344 type:complete len:230 (-) Transcript_46450:187-876(-)